MNTQNIILIAIVIMFAYAIYATNNIKKKVRCRYVSRSKQSFEKMIPSKSNYVYFESKKFYILPRCVTLNAYDKGIFSLFPTKVWEVSYHWNSPYPDDPNTGEPVMLSPEVEKTLDQEAALGDYAGSQQRALMGKGGKGGMLEKMMPVIVIVMALAVAYLVYTNFQSSKNDKVTQQAITDIYNTFNKIGHPVESVK
jgi:preprotein translocase subunit SecG